MQRHEPSRKTLAAFACVTPASLLTLQPPDNFAIDAMDHAGGVCVGGPSRRWCRNRRMGWDRDRASWTQRLASRSPGPMSTLARIADSSRTSREVRKVPTGDIGLGPPTESALRCLLDDCRDLEDRSVAVAYRRWTRSRSASVAVRNSSLSRTDLTLDWIDLASCQGRLLYHRETRSVAGRARVLFDFWRHGFHLDLWSPLFAPRRANPPP